MQRKPFPGTVIRHAAMLFVAGGLLASCAARPDMPGVPPSPNSRLYAYLIAHGMARGALMTRRVDAAGLPKLIALDRAAQKAVFNALNHQTARTDRVADLALSNLLGDFQIRSADDPAPSPSSEQPQKNRRL